MQTPEPKQEIVGRQNSSLIMQQTTPIGLVVTSNPRYRVEGVVKLKWRICQVILLIVALSVGLYFAFHANLSNSSGKPPPIIITNSTSPSSSASNSTVNSFNKSPVHQLSKRRHRLSRCNRQEVDIVKSKDIIQSSTPPISSSISTAMQPSPISTPTLIQSQTSTHATHATSTPTPSQSNSSSLLNSNSTAQSHKSTLTYYDPSTGGGFCTGITHKASDLIVALSSTLLTKDSLCKKYIELHFGSKSVKVQVVDQCDEKGGCRANNVDATVAVWRVLGIDQAIGVEQISWNVIGVIG